MLYRACSAKRVIYVSPRKILANLTQCYTGANSFYLRMHYVCIQECVCKDTVRFEVPVNDVLGMQVAVEGGGRSTTIFN